MGKKHKTVRDLAAEADIDLDEALVTLWDEGFTHIETPDDRIGKRELNRARRAFGLPTRREFRDPAYWRALFGMEQEQFRSLLTSLDIRWTERQRRLPRGCVSKLMAEARRRDLNPVTGLRRPKQPSTAPPPAPVDWEPSGHEKELRLLDEGEVLQIHNALVEDFRRTPDPIDPPGVRSEHLLASAVFRQHTALGGNLKYPTVETAAAALLHAIIQDHPFHNGNKRTALVALLVFMDGNGVVPTCRDSDLFRLVLQVAQHRIADPHPRDRADREVLAITDRLCSSSRLIEKGDNRVPWRKLKRILKDYGCTFEHPNTGNRINIKRIVEHRGFLGRRTRVSLRTQVHYADDGRDAGLNTIQKIRHDLHLDEQHGIDSRDFYQKSPSVPDDFILRYRKTLDRLAKL